MGEVNRRSLSSNPNGRKRDKWPRRNTHGDLVTVAQAEKSRSGSESAPLEWVTPLRRGAWPTVVLVLLYAFFWRWLSVTLVLPEESYRAPFVAYQVALTLSTTVPGLVGLVPLLILFAFRSKELLAPWSDYEGGERVRLLVMVLVIWATWATVTADHNLWFDRSHDLDRAVLIVLTVLVYRRPVFLIPYLFLFFPIEHQFDLPFGRQIFARVMLENLMALLVAAMLLRGLTHSRGPVLNPHPLNG